MTLKLVLALTMLLQQVGFSTSEFSHPYIKFVARFERAYNCENNGEEWPISFQDVVLSKLDRQTYTMNSDILSKVIVESPIGLLSVTRCSSRMGTICLHEVATLPLFELCSQLDNTTAFWAPFLKSIRPAFKCPVQPWVYRQRNSTFDDQSVLSELAVMGGPLAGLDPYWRVTIRINNQSVPLFCGHIVVSIRQIRIRKHTPRNNTETTDVTNSTTENVEDVEPSPSSAVLANQEVSTEGIQPVVEEPPKYGGNTIKQVETLLSALFLDLSVWRALVFKLINLIGVDIGKP